MNGHLVAPLRAFGRYDLARAGGKGANLGELVRAELPVPDGFVVTTEAYTAVASAGEPRTQIARLLAAGAEDGEPVRAAFEAAMLPDELLAAICSAYGALGGGPVAVRSSATAEDLPGAAFAGQQDTYLNVVGESALIDAVRRCWGSLWTDRAIAYRKRRGVDSAGAALAVVVQRMVPAECAGVMFTANPVTGERSDIVLDAIAGLGEALVSGHVTPEHYVLDQHGQVKPGSGEVSRLLSTGVLRQLAGLGAVVARLFGRPQDIEWASVGETVWLLQARPMTALPPPPLKLNRRQRLLGSVLLELLPSRPYPIDMSTWVPHGPAGLMAQITRTVGIRGAFEGFLIEDETGVVDRFVPPSPRPTAGLLLAPFRLARRARRYDPARWTEDPRFVEFLGRCRVLNDRDLATMEWAELVRVPRGALALLQPIGDLRIDYLPGAGLALVRLLLALKLLGRGAMLPDLIGGAPTRTEDANRALEALAEQVRQDPGLRQAFAELEPNALAATVAQNGQFQAAFSAFVAEYGHREIATAMLATLPTWGESPETVLGVVKVLAANPPAAATGEKAARTLEALLTHPLLRRLPGAGARMRRWVEAARTGVAFREDTHFYFTLALPVLRRSLLEMGRRLCGGGEAGVLRTPEDSYHLRLEELEAIRDAERLTPDEAERLRSLVRTRSARREELAGVPLINPSLIFPPRPGEAALVTGTPASSGKVTGRVCIVREPADFGKLQTGDILVCPYTNPAWTPLFLRAAAAVVDTGAVGSHAAIVAREYGIPAIMGTAVGTSVLNDGQRVTVDGGAGRVTAAD